MWPFKKNTICENNFDELQFVWGIKSSDDLTGEQSSLYTMNDIEIDYYGKEDVYLLSVETAYMFQNKNDEINYLEWLLNRFTEFMDINMYDKEYSYDLFMSDVRTINEAQSIPELYINFKMFVEGYKAVYKECNNE